MIRTTLGRASAVLALLVCLCAPASAELVFLTSGRSLSVKSHRVENGEAVLELRAGGEVVCDPAMIERIEPDEVPWPEPEVISAVAEVATALTGTPFADLIEPVAARHAVDPALVRAVIETESAFQPNARSPKGAMGLMQLMPATARQYAVANPYDPAANLEAGVRHLRALLDRYDVSLALAAYNAGEAAVVRYGGMPPFRETQDYVARVLRRAGVDARRPGPALGSSQSSRPGV